MSNNILDYYEKGLELAKSRIEKLRLDFLSNVAKYNDIKPIYDAYIINKKIMRSEVEIEDLNNRLKYFLDKENKILSIKNKALDNTNKKRDIAAKIKRKLAQFSNCPYCFGPLGNNPHADHIYPVSRGGESVPRNMVFICSSCNVSKGDKTLAAFIKKNKLDREKVEKELDLLGKDY